MAWGVFRFLTNNHNGAVMGKIALHKKSPYSEFFWSVFSCIRIEIYEVSLRIQSECGNTNQKISEYGHFLRSVVNSFQPLLKLYHRYQTGFSIRLCRMLKRIETYSRPCMFLSYSTYQEIIFNVIVSSSINNY